MALMKCPECGKAISSIAEQCPECGFPLKTLNQMNAVRNTSVIGWIGVIVGGLIASMVFFIEPSFKNIKSLSILLVFGIGFAFISFIFCRKSPK